MESRLGYQLPKQTKHEHCQSYNIQSYKPISTNGRNTIYNNSTNSNNNNVIINNNKKIIVNRNNNKLNKIKYLTLVNVNKNKNITEKNSPNKFLNTQIKKLNTQYISPNLIKLKFIRNKTIKIKLLYLIKL